LTRQSFDCPKGLFVNKRNRSFAKRVFEQANLMRFLFIILEAI
jgi:hypothetical protein